MVITDLTGKLHLFGIDIEPVVLAQPGVRHLRRTNAQYQRAILVRQIDVVINNTGADTALNFAHHFRPQVARGREDILQRCVAEEAEMAEIDFGGVDHLHHMAAGEVIAGVAQFADRSAICQPGRFGIEACACSIDQTKALGNTVLYCLTCGRVKTADLAAQTYN